MPRDSIIEWALKKQEELKLPNLRLMAFNADEINEVFEKDEVDRIYLNFSDPWPKDRHAKRRLESRQFLERYKSILKDGGLIEFKTDNNDLFDFALEEVKEAGWEMIAFTRDLHNNKELCEGNIMTEYEAKFSAMGNPINKYIIKKP